MKIIEKIIALGILTIILTVTSASPAGAHPFADVVGSKYDSAVKLLYDFGIVEGITDDSFAPDAIVTRADFVSTIIKLLGDIQISGGSLPYKDVTEDNSAYNEIVIAYQLGIINGMDNELFKPDVNVTYAEAVKIIVCLLGYKVEAETIGYPLGYLSKASQLGILSGITSDSFTPLTRGAMAVLIYNSLEVPLLVRTSYGGGSYNFTSTQDVTILSEYLHIYKYEGQISASYFTTIFGARILNIDEISMEGYIFKVGSTDASNMVGQNVTLYARFDESMDTKEIVSVQLNVNSLKTIVKSEDILPKTTTAKLYYEDDSSDKEGSVSINSSAKCIYNGKPLLTWDAQDIMPELGSVTLISNNGSSADVVIVENYKNYIVSGKNPDESTVYFKPNDSGKKDLLLAFNDTSRKISFINHDGTPAFIEDCLEWNILSVMESLDGSIMKIVRSAESVSGKVIELGSNEMTLEKGTYQIASDLLANNSLGKIEMGMEAVYYLDFFGNVTAFDKEAYRSGKYGYLVTVGIEKGLDKAPQFKIFTQDGGMKVFDTADKISVNNYTVSNKYLLVSNDSVPENVRKEINKIYFKDKVIEQLIMFNTNEAGEINSIETAVNGAILDESQREEVFSRDFWGRGVYYAYVLNVFNTKYRLGSKTVTFAVPEKYTGDNDSEYSIMPSTLFQHGEGYENLEFYDLDECNTISVILSRKVAKDTAAFSVRPALVTGLAKGISPDGEYCNIVRVLSEDGKEKSLYDADNVKAYFGEYVITDLEKETEVTVDDKGNKKLMDTISLTKLNPGDIIQYVIEQDKIKSAAVLFRSKSPKMAEKANFLGEIKTPRADTDYFQSLYLYTELEFKGDDSFKFHVPNASGSLKFERVHTYGAAYIVLFDLKREKAKVVTRDSFFVGDMFFAERFNPTERLIVIYR